MEWPYAMPANAATATMTTTQAATAATRIPVGRLDRLMGEWMVLIVLTFRWLLGNPERFRLMLQL
jgi:hypothetical protein